jgi:2-aminomuconate deaminase
MSDVVSQRAPEPVGPFPHAKRVGQLLFCSGIGPRTRNVRTVLEDAGSDWERIVDVTVFLTDMRRDFPTFNRLYGEHFPGNKPARTTVEVNALPTPIAIELKVIATID